MKKILLLLAFLLLANSLHAQSFRFLERSLNFGTSLESFLETYPEFKLEPSLEYESKKSAVYVFSPGNCNINYTVVFDNSALATFVLNSNCTVGEDQKYIDSILVQFEFVPSDIPDEEEMGDVMETYKKDNLIATAFIGGFYSLTIFPKQYWFSTIHTNEKITST